MFESKRKSYGSFLSLGFNNIHFAVRILTGHLESKLNVNFAFPFPTHCIHDVRYFNRTETINVSMYYIMDPVIL